MNKSLAAGEGGRKLEKNDKWTKSGLRKRKNGEKGHSSFGKTERL
jgi:hypothetical protein